MHRCRCARATDNDEVQQRSSQSESESESSLSRSVSTVSSTVKEGKERKKKKKAKNTMLNTTFMLRLSLLLLGILLVHVVSTLSTVYYVSGFVNINDGRIRNYYSSININNDNNNSSNRNRRRQGNTKHCGIQINQSSSTSSSTPTSSSSTSLSLSSSSPTSSSTSLLLPPIIGNKSNINRLLTKSTYETIEEGKIAIIPNFLNAADILPLRQDAQNLYLSNEFSTDALAGYGSSGNKFDPSKDRSVLKLNQWKNSKLGNYNLRINSLGNIMSNVRSELSTNLNRPQLNLQESNSVNKYGVGSTEISYTRFGPGSYLKRHVDEHHEELKGNDGWLKPTRRSISWLIYLNEPGSWITTRDGGQLRCYERKQRPIYGSRIGSSINGDLQIGWLTSSLSITSTLTTTGNENENKNEIPVYLDAKNHNHGECAMYFLDTTSTSSIQNNNNNKRNYITKPFKTNPILYVSGSEILVKKFLIVSSNIAIRFRLIEPPKSKLDNLHNNIYNNNNSNNNNLVDNNEEIIDDIDPFGGTLVLFDSVTLPHEVLETKNNKERWACSGWFHEDQQEINNNIK